MWLNPKPKPSMVRRKLQSKPKAKPKPSMVRWDAEPTGAAHVPRNRAGKQCLCTFCEGKECEWRSIGAPFVEGVRPFVKTDDCCQEGQCLCSF